MGDRRQPRSRCLGAAAFIVGSSVSIGCSPASSSSPDEEEEARAHSLAAVMPVAIAPASARPSACPAGMLLVEGMYCPEPRHVCKRWLDPPGRYHEFRCAEYEEPAVCAAERTPMRFCIDRDEHTEPGHALPANYQSLLSADQTCAALGGRICRESEWVFACEGEESRPYPYGFRRESDVCNADRTDIVDASGKLIDRRVRSDAFPECTSPFGVRNLAGNLEEVVAIDGTSPPRAALKGAYWQPGRNTCRAAQTAHDAYYHGVETGFRCCADAEP